MAASEQASLAGIGDGWSSQAFVQESATLDWVEPLDAYLRLRLAGRKPVLLDGLGLHPEARHAYIAFTPVHELKVESPFALDAGEAGSTETRGNVLGHMAHVLRSSRLAAREDAPFTGGWVGFLSYEFSRVLEPSLPPRKGPPGVADALLVLHADALVLDRQERTCRLFCAGLDGDRAPVRRRLDAVRADLKRDAVRPRLPSPEGATPWRSTMTQDQFQVAVADVRRLIHDGDLFQANLASGFTAPCDADPAALFAAVQQANPSPYMALWEQPGFAIVSGSPEQLVAVDAATGTVRSRPIAGTRKRGATADADAGLERELLTDAKEQAEHTMLVDLVRNDVAKVSRPGTVRVPERMSVERYRHVMHLVSRVEGTLRDGLDAWDALLALFPGGTVTGAPKVRACQRIHAAEPASRGLYTGSFGYVSWSGNAHWNILIRTLLLAEGQATVFAGSGVVADSDPEREWKEANRKARALQEAVEGRVGAGSADRLGEVARHGSWAPSTPPRRLPGRRVLLIDNYDSFVHNLADYCGALGAEVRVVRNDADWRRAVADFRPTHVIVSPGPGWPAEAGCSVEVVRELGGKLPVLGVCLGHQAIGAAAGAAVDVHPRGPVHGRPDAVVHDGEGLFRGLPSPLLATRYHSLVVRDGTIGSDWIVDARLADGTVMALRHRTAPTYGLQFHPESICTDRGLELLATFLETGLVGKEPETA